MNIMDYSAIPDEQPPPLHADGATDDTDAVQWHLDRGLPLPRGIYLVSRPIVTRRL